MQQNLIDQLKVSELPKCGELGEEEWVIPHGHERQLVEHPVHHREHHGGCRRRGDPRPTTATAFARDRRNPNPRVHSLAPRAERLDNPLPTIGTGRGEAGTARRREREGGSEERQAPPWRSAAEKGRRRGGVGRRREEVREGHGARFRPKISRGVFVAQLRLCGRRLVCRCRVGFALL
jgi:hypothetical protein